MISNLEKKIRSTIDFLYSILPGQGSIYLNGDFRSTTAYDEAAGADLFVVLPEANQLQIDIDNDWQYAIFEKNIKSVEHFYGKFHKEETPSKSGLPRKKHITLTARRSGVTFEPKERLILQAFLGSDPTREFLGLQRIKVNDPVPTLFLERKPRKFEFYGDFVEENNDIPF